MSDDYTTRCPRCAELHLARSERTPCPECGTAGGARRYPPWWLRRPRGVREHVARGWSLIGGWNLWTRYDQ